MYLTHAAAIRITEQYLNVSQFAQEVGKPFMMFETNSASCGGFPGISDAFAAALWGLDYGLMMAYSNFTGALFHIGGQNVYYNVSPLFDKYLQPRFLTQASPLAIYSYVRIQNAGLILLIIFLQPLLRIRQHSDNGPSVSVHFI